MTCTVLRVEPPVLFEHTHFVDGVTLRWDLEAAGHRAPAAQHVVPNVDEAIEGCWIVGMHTSLDRLEPASPGGRCRGTGTPSPPPRPTTPSTGLAAPVAEA